MNPKVLEVNNLTYKIPLESQPLFHIDHFHLNKNDKILISGLSGKGKTTLLHIMAGFILKYNDQVHLFNKKLSNMSDKELDLMRTNQLSFIFQKLNLITTFTPFENLKLVSKGIFHKEDALSILDRLGLKNKAHTITHKLSTGEQQRVACARALFSRPQILFADEPTSNLDDFNTKNMMELILEYNPDITMLIVSHDNRLEKYFTHTLNFNEMITS